jgi:FtsZ-binding cell division protein ZapB
MRRIDTDIRSVSIRRIRGNPWFQKIRNPQSHRPTVMKVSGLEKFSHLEDKIYRTVELCNKLRLEIERLEVEIEKEQSEKTDLIAENLRLAERVERLLEDRESMRLKVEAMLDAIAMLELESESLKK